METQIKNCKWRSVDGGNVFFCGGGRFVYNMFNAALTAVFKSSSLKIKLIENVTVSCLGQYAK